MLYKEEYLWYDTLKQKRQCTIYIMITQLFKAFKRLRFVKYLPIALISISAVFAIYTLWLLGNDIDGQNDTIHQLIIIDAVLLGLIMLMLGMRFYNIFIHPRNKQNNSGLQQRMVALFSVFALVPTILITIFALIFFNFGLKTWFSERVSSALHSSRVVANAYLQEHQNTIVTDALSIARGVDSSIQDLTLEQDELEQFLLNQGLLRDLTEVLVFDTVGNIYGRYGLTAVLELEPISYDDLTRANQGEVVVFADSEVQRVRALIRLNNFLNTYMFIGRFLDPKVVGYIDNTDVAITEYESLEQSRDILQVSFTFVFVLVVLMLLTVAIWLGLGIAHTLVQPLRSLMSATQSIKRGKYNLDIQQTTKYAEIQRLIESFNDMSKTIYETTQGLRQANQDILDRSQFIETLLSDIRTGIISLDVNDKVLLINAYGANLLQKNREDCIGKDIGDVVFPLAQIIQSVRHNTKPYMGQISYTQGFENRQYIVRVALEYNADVVGRLIVSFDDITDVERTQKKAAWADVARRMAHEIKNPLTPIQLSAERLKRRYAKTVDVNDAVFETCTNTIIRQVEEIGRMVNEFDGFARMPAPKMALDNFTETVKSAYSLQKNAHSHIQYQLDCPQDIIWQHDRHHISQMITNIMKNALNVLMEKQVQSPKILVVARHSDNVVVLSIHDNGDGFPKSDRDSLFDPYVTNHKDGTGLGLSIVKKIVEDHNGTVALLDSPVLGGALVEIEFNMEL